jgi:predicted secreted protein
MRLAPVLTGLLVIGALAASGAGPPAAVRAQTPGQGPGPRVDAGFHGNVPAAGGIGLLATTRDQDRDQIMLHLEDRDCAPLSLAVIIDGRWRVYIPGAPPQLASDFPEQLTSSTAFFVRCRDTAPSIVRVGASDSGTSVSLEVGQRLRVTLESNPTTGYSWLFTGRPAPMSSVRPTGMPDPAVLQLVRGPIFVPASTLIGAGGTETYDFVATAAGTTSIALEYARPFEAAPGIDNWTVTVTVGQ